MPISYGLGFRLRTTGYGGSDHDCGASPEARSLDPVATAPSDQRWPWPSDDRTVGDDPTLGHDHDALADVVAVPVRILHGGLVDDVDATSHASVLVHDGALDHRLRPDAHRRLPSIAG